MKSTIQQHRSDKDLDELTIYDAIFTILSHKTFIVFLTLVVMIGTYVSNSFLPKSYKVTSSFFANTGNSMGSSALRQYSAFLGGGGNSDVENRVEEVIKSKSMELVLTEKAAPFFPEISDKFKLKDELNFEKKFQLVRSPKSLFTLSYESHNPELSYFIVKECLSQVIQFNKRLQLSEKSDIIIILDPPQKPLRPSGPRMVFNTLLGGMAAFMFAVFAIFSRRAISAYKMQTKA